MLFVLNKQVELSLLKKIDKTAREAEERCQE